MKDLASLSDLETLLASPPPCAVIYKHSTQCGMCDAAIEEVQAFEEREAAATLVYYLDLLAHRDVSNAVSERLGIRHESPQVIFLKSGKPATVLNHRAIRQDALRRAHQAVTDSASQNR